jgi:hypothetical protein
MRIAFYHSQALYLLTRGADGLRKDLAGFSRRVVNIRRVLQDWTYTGGDVHQDHVHNHHHHHHRHDFWIRFFALEQVHVHPRHHHEVILEKLMDEWTSTKDGIAQAFLEFRIRVQTKQKAKDDEKKAKDNVKKMQDDAKKNQETAVKKVKEEMEKLEEELGKERDHQEKLRNEQEARERGLEDDVHNLAHRTLSTDPVSQVGNIAVAMHQIQSLQTPPDQRQPSHEQPIRDLREIVGIVKDMEGDRRGGQYQYNPWNTAPWLSNFCVDCMHNGHHHHRYEGTRSSSLPTYYRRGHHDPTVVVQNNVGGAEVEVEEAPSAGNGNGNGHGADHGNGHGADHGDTISIHTVNTRPPSPTPSSSTDTMSVHGGDVHLTHHGTKLLHHHNHDHHGGFSFHRRHENDNGVHVKVNGKWVS